MTGFAKAQKRKGVGKNNKEVDKETKMKGERGLWGKGSGFENRRDFLSSTQAACGFLGHRSLPFQSVRDESSEKCSRSRRKSSFASR